MPSEDFSVEENEQSVQLEIEPSDVKPVLRLCYDTSLEDLREFFPYLDATKHQTVALWLTGAWVMRAFSKYPLLHVTGVKGSGKSVLASLAVRHAGMKHYMNPTTAVLFRAPVKRIVVDECEVLDTDKVTVLNAAHQRGIKVPRLKSQGGETEISEFEPYGAYLIAGIRSRFPASLMSRMIQVPLRPYQWTADPARLALEAPEHTSFLARYAEACLLELSELYTKTSTKLKPGRFRDCYRGLIVLAKYLDISYVDLFHRLREEENAIEDDESYTEMEIAVVKFLLTRVPTGQDWVKVGEIGSAVGITTNYYPLREALSRLTLNRKKRTQEGFFVYVDRAMIDDTWERMRAL